MHERTQELEVVSEALGRAIAGAGGAVLIEGPAGIGKTTLLRAVRDAAGERDLPAFSARGTELERSHAFGAARRLLGPMVEELGENGFGGPAAAARAVLSDDSSLRSTAAESPTAKLLGLVAVIGIAADTRGPLLLAIDDAQWLDEPTLDLLAMIASRLEDLPVLLVAAARTGETSLAPSLARLAADPAVRRLPLAPLGAPGVEALLRERLGRDPESGLSEAALEATGGNPWFVTALADELARGSAGARTPDELGSLPPRAIAETVEARVAAVAAEGPAVTEALTVLGDDAEPRQLAELAGVALEKAVEVLDSLVEAGVLARSSPARFSHAIVRASVERRVGAGRRALGHRRAAHLLAAEGAAPERVAAHLLRSEPAGEQWAVVALLEAGEVARGRGAPERAAADLERALAEPPELERRGEVLALLGAAELEAGRSEAAADHLAEALRGDENPPVDVLRRLAQAHVTGGEVELAVSLLERTLDRGGLDDEAQAMLTADLAVLAVFAPSVAQRARTRLHVLSAMDGATPGGRLVVAARARDLLFRGLDREETVRAAERALGRGRLAAESSVWIAWSYAVNSLIVADRGDLALEEIDRVLDDLVARAAVGWYCVARTLRADAQLRAGRVRSALADAAGAVEAGSDHGLSTLPASAANLAASLFEHDQLEESDGVLREHGLYDELPEHVLFFPALYSRARTRLTRGETEAAVVDLFEIGERERRWDIAQPCGYPWRVAAVRGLARLGRAEEAAPLAQRQAELAERWRCPRASALGELALGLAEPDRERAARHFRTAAEETGGDAPLVRIEALIELGRAIRQRGERALAREPLREALDQAQSLSALRLASEAEEELRAARGRPPKRTPQDDELTPSERRIARLAATGASNREIAARLFLSVRTVETHLTSAYRRLGISSRRELPKALAQRPGELAEPASS